MALHFLAENETYVAGSEGYIEITQTLRDGQQATIFLTEHQFMEIYNRSKHIIEELRGSE